MATLTETNLQSGRQLNDDSEEDEQEQEQVPILKEVKPRKKARFQPSLMKLHVFGDKKQPINIEFPTIRDLQ